MLFGFLFCIGYWFQGNTLWSLSQKYKVSMLAIQKANGIVNPDLIYAGNVEPHKS